MRRTSMSLNSTPREESNRSSAPSFASLASISLHVSLVYLATSCPVGAYVNSRYDTDAMRAASRVTRRASDRLTYITPLSEPKSLAAPAPRVPNAPAKRDASAESKIGSDDAASGMTSDTTQSAIVDSAASSRTASVKADSVATAPRGYERPIHPALRGLVPEWNGGAMWKNSRSAVLLPPSLPPRPDCGADDIPCKRRLFQWRADSVFHVTFTCRIDPRNPSRIRPADCNLFLTDSTRERFLTSEINQP